MDKYTEFTVGTDKYNNEKLQSAMFNNIDAYADKQGFNDLERLLFREAVGYTLLGMRDGSISQVDLNGNLLDNKGQGNSMMGQALHYMRDLLRNDTGNTLRYQSAEKKKYSKDLDDDFKNYFNAGKDPDEDFTNSWINRDSADSEGKRSTKNRAAAYSEMLKDKINKIQNGEYDMTDVNGLEELNNLTAALNALADGNVTDDEISILAKAGHTSGATSLLFGKGEVSSTPSWETTRRKELKEEGYTQSEINELIRDEKLTRRWEREDAMDEKRSAHEEKLNTRAAKLHEQLWKKYANATYLGNFNNVWNIGTTSFKNTSDYEKALLKLNVDPEKFLSSWLNNPTGYTGTYSNGAWLKNYLSYLALTNAANNFIQDENGNNIIIKSINYANGRALAYDPSTGTLKEVSPSASSKLRDILRTNWYNHNPAPTIGSTTGNIFKDGGILKFISGGNIDYTVEDILQAYLNGQITLDQAELALQQLLNNLNPTNLDNSIKDKNGLYSSSSSIPAVTQYSFLGGGNSTPHESLLSTLKKKDAAAKVAAFKNKAAANGRSVEAELYGESTGGGFSNADKIRLTNMVNDLSSIGLSYVPIYGTAIAGAQGLASMGIDLFADAIDKNVSRSLMLGNLAENAGFAALGMIPGGTGKIGKVFKTFKKLLPAGLSAMGLMNTITDKNVLNSLDKLTKFDDASKLTKDDWKNLMNVAKMVAFGHNTGKAASQSYNGWLKEKSWTPSALRKWGEASIGSKQALDTNTKLILLGSTDTISKEQAEVNDISGKTISINTEDGVQKLTLKPSAYKLLNESIKDKKDSTEALKTVNDTINNWMHNNPESYFRESTEGFKALKEADTKKVIKGLKIKGSENEANLYQTLSDLIKDKTNDTDKVSLKLSNTDGERALEVTVKDIKDFRTELLKKAGINEEQLIDLADFNTKWEGVKDKQIEAENAVNALFNSRFKIEDTIPGAEKPFTTTLNTADIYIPGSVVGKLPEKNAKVKLTDVGPSLGKQFSRWAGEAFDAVNPIISDKYTGASDTAALNRSKIITARAYEKMAKSPQLASIFNNNWEMANGAGPFRFGISGSATTDEYNKAREVNRNTITFGYDDRVKDFINTKAAQGTVTNSRLPWYKLQSLKFYSTPEGQRWKALEDLKGRKLTLEEATKFIDDLELENTMKTSLAKDILNEDGTLKETFKEKLILEPEINQHFLSLTDEDVRELTKIYGDKTLNGEQLINKIKEDLNSPKNADNTIKGIKLMYEDLAIVDDFINRNPNGKELLKQLASNDPILKDADEATILKALRAYIEETEGVDKINEILGRWKTSGTLNDEDKNFGILNISNFGSGGSRKRIQIDPTKAALFEKLLLRNGYKKANTVVGTGLPNTIHAAYVLPSRSTDVYWWKNGSKIEIGNKLLALKAGGKLLKLQSGGAVDNMNFSLNNGRSNWKQSIYDNYGNDINNRIDSLNDNDLLNYVSWINNMLDRHAAMYKAAGSDYTKKVGYSDAVKQYQLDYDNNDQAGYNTGTGKNAIQKAFQNGRYLAVGYKTRTSGDGLQGNFKADGLYGAITDDRRILGRISNNGEDDWTLDLINAMNQRLNKRGYHMFLDKNTNYYKIGRLNNPTNPTIIEEGKDKAHPWKKLGLIGQGILTGIGDNADKIMELGNYLLHARSNKKIWQLQRNAIRPVLQDYFNSHLELLRDTNAELVALRLAGKLNTMAGTAKTSDASTLMASLLDAADKGAQYIIAANQESNAKAHLTAQAQAENQITNAKLNLQINYANRTAELAAKKAKADLDAQYEGTKATNLDNLLEGYIYDVKTNKADRKAAMDLIALSRYNHSLDDNTQYQSLLKQYLDLNLKDTLTDNEKKLQTALYNQLAELAPKIKRNAENDYLAYYLNRSNPITYSSYNISNNLNTNSYKYKKGGTVETTKDIREARIRARSSDDKEFNKNILNGIKNHLKLVDNMSRGTLLAIKKALNL